MKLIKVAAFSLGVAMFGSAFAQSQNANQNSANNGQGNNADKSETNVEEEYLSTMEDTIVTELAKLPDRDNKELSLRYIADAVEGGSLSPVMQQTLADLAGEGITSESRTNGRLMNNFPDIRAKACDIMANVKTEESKNALKAIAISDNEPMVITAAIRSLGEVGINENDEVVTAIAWAHKRTAILNPTSSLAFEVLEAYEKLKDTVKDNKVMVQSVAEIATNNRYVPVVREKARKLLQDLQSK